MTGTKPNDNGPARKPPDTAVEKSRIYIVDDHEMFRDGLRQLINLEPDFTVCGDAPDAEQAMADIQTLKPDLVIVDISLAGTSGIDLVRLLKRDYEELPVLVVSMHAESLYGERALRAGAMGYIMKSEPARTVLAAVRKVLRGEVHVSEKM